MKKIILKLFLVFIPLLFTNCASTLNSKMQKVTVFTVSDDCKVYVNDKLQGKGSSVKTKMERNQSVKQVKIEREGYKTVYSTHYQDRKSPLYIMSWVPFGVLFYPPFLDFGPKSFDYARKLTIEEKPVKILSRTDNMKYLFLKNTAFDVEKEDLEFKRIKKRRYEKNISKYKSVITSDEDLDFDNSIFNSALNEILLANNYFDTTETIFKSRINSAYISAKVTEISFEEVYEQAARSTKSFVVGKSEIEWEIFDLYDQSLYKTKVESKSGQFSYSFNGKDILRVCMEDMLKASFFRLLGNDDVKEILELGTEKDEKLEFITLNNNGSNKSLEEAINATVTIKVDKGHGSGCVISNDGYILTNFHVVSGDNKNIYIITQDGVKLEAKIVRKNVAMDLALLKVEKSFDKIYTLPSSKNYSIGQDVYAIGTPSNIDLGQTLSKGIVSGLRTPKKNTNYIQTDASINSGNSGGALVNKKGELIGIVNSKVFGFGVEGLAFAIPAVDVQKFLFLNY
ncbi:trypsin-like peptidase domain-containing protein [Aquimarina sp. 2201CG1-2-11]|uniref:S1C family serine protease n=1 Tax=Aquimarina discodermiae TaxID=3231043 RepID=UPI0034623F1B